MGGQRLLQGEYRQPSVLCIKRCGRSTGQLTGRFAGGLVLGAIYFFKFESLWGKAFVAFGIAIYRTHHLSEGEKPEVFIAGFENVRLHILPPEVADRIAAKLLDAGYERVYFGRVFEAYHDKFKAEIDRTVEA